MRPKLAIAIALAALAYPAAAQADQYVVDHCRHFDPESPFVAFAQVSGVDVDDCNGGTGGLNARALGGAIAANTSLTIGLSIPADRPNIRIERVQSLYAADAPNSGSASLSFLDHLDQAIRTDAAPAVVPIDTPLPAGARSLRWRLTCGAAPCQFQDEFPLFVNKNRLYLNESMNPTLVVTGGALVGTGAKAGQQAVQVDVSDTDSGVASVTVTLGSTVVGAAQLTCAFADWSVCPRAEAGRVVQADTTKVPDGNHELAIAVRDAAGNTLTRSLGAVSVANGAAAGAPGTIPSPANGAGASRFAKLSARFTTTTARTRRVRFTARPTVRGRLVDEHGAPIAGAVIAILERRRESRAATVQVASAQTGADGAFSHKLAAGPSRTITLAYTAFAGDPKPSATSVLRTDVRALISARVTPRTTRADRRITLSGRLRLLPRARVEVKIQARDGRVWRTIDSVRTTAQGRFRWRYRFKPVNSGRTYALRARVDSPVYPFAPGNSRPVRVRVR